MTIRNLAAGAALLAAFAVAPALHARVPLQQAAETAERFSRQPVKWGALRTSSDPEVRLSKRPARVTAPNLKSPQNSLNVFGYITMSENWDFMPQWVELTSDGYDVKWADQDYWLQGEVKLDIGWIRDGKLCGYATKLFMGQQLLGYYYKEFDLSTGLSTLTKEMDFENSNLFMTAAYSPDSDMIFGFGIDPQGSAMLLKAPGADPTNISVARDLSEGPNEAILQSICWNDADKRFVGVNYSGEAVTLTLEGKLKTLAEYIDVPLFTPYYTGMCYDATNRVYYWNITDEHSSYIYRLDATSFEGELVSTFEENDIFSVLYSPSKVVDADAPQRPEFISASFENGSLSGTANFHLPQSLLNGGSIDGQMHWTATLDGAPYATGMAIAGADVEVNYENLAEGMHTLGLYATYNDKESAEGSTELFVGIDTPAMPKNVQFSTTSVSWDAVTTGQHNGYVDPASIEYEVFVDARSMGSTSDTHLDISLDDSEPITTHTATVVAIGQGRRSEPGVSNKLAYGQPLSLPLSIRPTAEEFLLMTTTDANGDGYGWHYVGEVTDPDFPCLDSDYSHSLTEPADDWLFLPPVVLDDTEAFYNFKLWAKGRMTQLQPDEYFEVFLGTQPLAESMTQCLIPRTKAIFAFNDYEKYFRVPQAGTYYIGIHAISDPAMFGVRIRDLYLYKSNIESDSPNVPTAASATPADGGRLSATVAFTMPLKTVDGADYPEGTVLRAVVSGDTNVEVSGAPGEKVSAEVRTVQGDNRIRITPYCGEAVGLPVDVTVYTGIDIPTAPPSIYNLVDETNQKMTLRWTVPTVGEHNGFLDPNGISYQIHAFNAMFGWIPFDQVAPGVTEYLFESEEEITDGLAYVRLGVSAANEAGSSKYLSASGGVLGVPYALPFSDAFDEAGGASVGPWVSVGGADVTWGFADLADISYDWANIPGGALVGMPAGNNVYSYIAFPKFTTIVPDGKTAAFSLRVWTGGGAPKKMQLYALAAGMEAPTLLETITTNGGWKDVSVVLPEELQNRGWVQMQMRADFASTKQLCVIDKFGATIEAGLANLLDSKASISVVPAGVQLVGLEGHSAMVYSLDGRLVAKQDVASQKHIILLPKGAYIVKAGPIAAKVVL